MATTINKKINIIFILLERLAKGEELYSQNENLQFEIFGDIGEANERALRRYLSDIHELYGDIVLTEKKKKALTDRSVTIYRIQNREKDVSTVLKFFIENSDNLFWVLDMIHKNDPSFLKDLDVKDKHLIEENIKEDEGIFIFKSSPFESFEDSQTKEIFNNLKKAVKNHEYRSITYEKNREEYLEDMKCIKLVYMNNNWYLATENEDKRFRFLRLSFIKKVGYSKNNKVTFQGSRVEHYHDYFASVQNAMTLEGTQFKKATLKASPGMSLYFKENMKPFFPSQEYVKTEEDGSIVFTVEYTQPLEVLPFIKQWLPDIEIVAPEKLKQYFMNDMQKSLKVHGT
jgi:hypothetical protein